MSTNFVFLNNLISSSSSLLLSFSSFFSSSFCFLSLPEIRHRFFYCLRFFTSSVWTKSDFGNFFICAMSSRHYFQFVVCFECRVFVTEFNVCLASSDKQNIKMKTRKKQHLSDCLLSFSCARLDTIQCDAHYAKLFFTNVFPFRILFFNNFVWNKKRKSSEAQMIEIDFRVKKKLKSTQGKNDANSRMRVKIVAKKKKHDKMYFYRFVGFIGRTLFCRNAFPLWRRRRKQQRSRRWFLFFNKFSVWRSDERVNIVACVRSLRIQSEQHTTG